jgi:hypothetical protein
MTTNALITFTVTKGDPISMMRAHVGELGWTLELASPFEVDEPGVYDVELIVNDDGACLLVLWQAGEPIRFSRLEGRAP